MVNIPFSTVMLQVVADLHKDTNLNLPLFPLIFALAFGIALGGKFQVTYYYDVT